MTVLHLINFFEMCHVVDRVAARCCELLAAQFSM